MTLLLLIACTDYDLQKVEEPAASTAAIEVTPNPVLFGELPAGEVATQAFTISSVGTAALNVTAVSVVAGESNFSLITGGVVGTWAPGESVDVLVTYLSTGGSVTGQALVLSNDPAYPEVPVDLMGGAQVPDLVIDPDRVSFGAATVGSTVERSVVLRNVGEGPLTVTGIATTDPVFSYAVSTAFPLTIAPGEGTDVAVAFTPDADSVWTGELQVTSNDPDGVETAQLNGSAGSQPVAMCSVTPDTLAVGSGTADWIGADSYDPGGYAITDYTWTLTSKPSGSSARMPSGGANRRGFSPDREGTYEAQLVVTNTIGDRSEPCFATLEATPPPPATEPIYLNSGSTLYSFDPVAAVANRIGDFDDGAGGPDGSMVDIAIDLTGNMYGTTFSTLYRIDPSTARVRRIGATDDTLIGLTCLSDGRLVGAGAGVYFVDTATAALTDIVPAGRYATSGDIVGLPDGNLYWTVALGTDHLIVVNPATGGTVDRGNTGLSSVYGLAWYDDVLWGFTSDGYGAQIDVSTARSSSVRITGSSSWYGATTNPVTW